MSDSPQSSTEAQPETACRICGLDDGSTILWQHGFPTYIICDCCGNESGIGDDNLPQVRELRGLWIGNGAPWYLPSARPDVWELSAQLAQIDALWRSPGPLAPVDSENPKYPYPVTASGPGDTETQCRVCAWDDGTLRWAVGTNGIAAATGAVCDCCGARSGRDDVDLGQVRERRGAWAGTLGQWHRPQARPSSWNLAVQIQEFPSAVDHQKTGAAEARKREAEIHRSVTELEEMKRQLGLS